MSEVFRPNYMLDEESLSMGLDPFRENLRAEYEQAAVEFRINATEQLIQLGAADGHNGYAYYQFSPEKTNIDDAFIAIVGGTGQKKPTLIIITNETLPPVTEARSGVITKEFVLDPDNLAYVHINSVFIDGSTGSIQGYEDGFGSPYLRPIPANETVAIAFNGEKYGYEALTYTLDDTHKDVLYQHPGSYYDYFEALKYAQDILEMTKSTDPLILAPPAEGGR